MDTDTVIVRIEGGKLAGVDFVNPGLRHGVVVYDGVAERCMRLRPLHTEADIAQAVQFVRDGIRNEAWQELSSWASAVATALAQVGKTTEPFIERCFAFRTAHQGDPARLLGDIREALPQIGAVKEALRDALYALDQATVVCERAGDVIAAESAAQDGYEPRQPSAALRETARNVWSRGRIEEMVAEYERASRGVVQGQR